MNQWSPAHVMKPRQAQGRPMVAPVGCAMYERALKDLIDEAERFHADDDLTIKHLFFRCMPGDAWSGPPLAEDPSQRQHIPVL
jgi:hypothetical protein